MINQNNLVIDIHNEKQIIADDLQLQNDSCIEFIDSGWDSRVYYIPSAKIIYKFPRSAKIKSKYKNEIAVMKAVHHLNGEVAVPKVLNIGANYDYYSYKALLGTELSHVDNKLDIKHKERIGTQLGHFLKDMHTQAVVDIPQKTVEDEIKQLAKWSARALDYIKQKDGNRIHEKVTYYASQELPYILRTLKVASGLCHGDFHLGNIIIDNDSIGLIDFGDTAYMDTSNDFARINDVKILQAMYFSYGVDDMFRKKVNVRKSAFDFVKLTANIAKKDMNGAERNRVTIVDTVMSK